MQAVKIIDHITVEEYLEGELKAEHRHEYVYGEVHTMAGTTRAHNIIAGNIARAIGLAAETTSCLILN